MMKFDLLREYIELMMEDELARIPNQLVEPVGDDDDEEKEEIETEASGVASIAGGPATPFAFKKKK